MLRHIFIGTFKAGISNEIKSKVLADLRAIKDKIPSVVELHTNFSKGWVGSENSVVMTVDFASKADFDSYIAHTYHVDYLMKQSAEYLSSYVAAQFEL